GGRRGEGGVEEGSQREGPPGFLLESRGALDLQAGRRAQDVQADAESDISVLTLRARLGEDAADLPAADEEVVGPLQLDADAGRVAQSVAYPSRDRDRHQRDRLARPGLPHAPQI